jgi:hypothetical protein
MKLHQTDLHYSKPYASGFKLIHFGVAAVLSSALLLLQGCNDDPKIGPPLIAPSGDERVAVLCEGNFMWANAKMDVITTDTAGSKIWNNAFESVNNKPIGDVLQSGLVAGNNLFLSVNNSGKVLGLDPFSLKQTKSNTTLKSPRNLLMVGDRLWVSDLYANKISILDTSNLKTVKEIVVPGWTESMVWWGGYVAVAAYKGEVLLIDVASQTVEKTLQVDSGALHLAVDAAMQLWVGCSINGKSTLTAFALGQINVIQVAHWEMMGDVGSIQTSRNGSTLFVSRNNKIWSFKADAQSEANMSVLLDPKFTQLYGYYYDAQSNVMYCADAKDYVSNGVVLRYPLDNPSKKTLLNTGVNPSGFVRLP